MKKVVLIPAYEPEKEFVNLVKNIKKEGLDIVVVDDGSGWRYRNIFKAVAEHAKVLAYKKNKGKGHALRLGLRYIATHYDNDIIICTMDSDGQHAIDDAKKLIRYSVKNPDALVLGRRKLGRGIPFKSQLGNGITRFLYKLKMDEEIYDNQTGLRTFSGDLLPMMCRIGGERYVYEMYVIMTCEAKDIPIKEVPIKTIYINGNKGSHFRPFKDSFSLYGSMITFSPYLAKKHW